MTSNCVDTQRLRSIVFALTAELRLKGTSEPSLSSSSKKQHHHSSTSDKAVRWHRTRGLDDRERDLDVREHVLRLREADVRAREEAVAARERRVQDLIDAAADLDAERARADAVSAMHSDRVAARVWGKTAAASTLSHGEYNVVRLEEAISQLLQTISESR
eukprot:PhM_4_TR13016/c0_g1_i1/m.53254